jgi:DNA-binding PadR family transcriptional regulator
MESPGTRADRFLPLTAVVFDILISLADEPRHGYAMLGEIEARTGRRLRAGTLYRALSRLVDEELVEEVVEASGAEASADDRRKPYGMTALGRAVVAAEAARLEAAVRDARSKNLLGRA